MSLCRCEEHETPMDDLSLNVLDALNGQSKKVCLTRTSFPGGRRLQDEFCQTIRASGRQSFFHHVLRDRLLCDEACDLLRF